MERAPYSTPTQSSQSRQASTFCSQEHHSRKPCPVSRNWSHLALQHTGREKGSIEHFSLIMWGLHLPHSIMTLNLRDWPGHTAGVPLWGYMWTQIIGFQAYVFPTTRSLSSAQHIYQTSYHQLEAVRSSWCKLEAWSTGFSFWWLSLSLNPDMKNPECEGLLTK